MIRITIGTIAMIFLCGAVFGAGDLNLAGMEGWTIVVSSDAIPSEHYAAQEFQSLFKQALGIQLPIANQPPQASRNVFIGSGEGMAAVFPGLRTDDLGEEGLHRRGGPRDPGRDGPGPPPGSRPAHPAPGQ